MLSGTTQTLTPTGELQTTKQFILRSNLITLSKDYQLLIINKPADRRWKTVFNREVQTVGETANKRATSVQIKALEISSQFINNNNNNHNNDNKLASGC